MKYILGIDDAGRGPIIGPMVIGGTIFKKEDIDKLKKLGVKDSKMIVPKKREFLSNEIKKIALGYKAVKITPLEIDNREENGLNLNDLEALKMAEAINELSKGLKDIDVIIDCPSTNIEAWKLTLLRYIKEPAGKKFIVEHKADDKYVACSAASIIAKVVRDWEIEKIKEEINVDFGSGYPADPQTVKFINERGHKYLKYHIIRESWQTWKNIMVKKNQKKLF
ncbi:ribonuclease HII [Nanoarchaeota archaeon]